jgi:zinc/manganese transport system substrate-binding protein
MPLLPSSRRSRACARGAIPPGAVLALAGLVTALLAGCGSSSTATASGTSSPSTSGRAAPGAIAVVAAENEYGDVATQIGGRYVAVTSIESNPNTDPHTYEVSPSVADDVSKAQLVIQNGVGYDTFMNKIESASPSHSRQVIDVQQLLKLPNSTPNPHLWYSPTTMPAVAEAIDADLSRLDPSQTSYFGSNTLAFIQSLTPWTTAIAAFKADHPSVTVATTEPVADYMLEAVGADNLTPFRFQSDIMNGVDPSPQDVSLETNLLDHHRVQVFVYNQQVTDSLTQSFIADAHHAGVPVVGVYETMPSGYHYQTWMVAEVQALLNAVVNHRSTQSL